MAEIIDRLQLIFQDVLVDKTLQLRPESDANTVEGWDSVAHIQIITSVEHEFKVSFELEELEGLNNVGDLIALIAKKA